MVGKIAYTTDFKKKVVNEVKKGNSFSETSRNFDVPITTLRLWCINEGVESKYKVGDRITNEQIISKIKESKAVKTSELMELLNLSSEMSLSRRLKGLVINGEIKETILSGKTKNSGNLKHYMNRRIFYINNEDLKDWLIDQLPQKMPKNLRIILNRKFKEMGLEFQHKQKKKYIPLSQKRYNRIKNQAQKEGKTIEDYVEAKFHD